MVAFVPGDLPSSLNQIEQVHVWSACILQNLFPTVTVLENPGQAQFVASTNPFFLDVPDPPEWRMIIRTTLPMNPNWQRGGTLWTNTRAINTGNIVLPNEFRA